MSVSEASDLQIVGLACPCCADEVVKATRAVAGVVAADLDYRSGILRVRLEPGIGSAAAVRDAVRAVGYGMVDDAGGTSTGQALPVSPGPGTPVAWSDRLLPDRDVRGALPSER